MSNIKSGKEIIDEFFADILNIEGVDRNIASTLFKLYNEGKLTAPNITNALSELRDVKE